MAPSINEEKRPTRKEKSTDKPKYEKPRLIKLEDEIKWSRGGCIST